MSFRALRPSLLIYILLLSGWITPALASPLAAMYRCGAGSEHAQIGDIASQWRPVIDGHLSFSGLDYPCWVRIDSRPAAHQLEGSPWLSLYGLHVQRLEASLFNASGVLIGHAQRMGNSDRALVSGQRAIFSSTANQPLPLYLRISLSHGVDAVPGLAHELQLEAVDATHSLIGEQRSDQFNLSISVILLSSAVFALLLGLALRDVNFALFSLYAGFQAVTHYSKSGLAFIWTSPLPALLDIWSLQCSVSALAMLLNLRFGNFQRHSRKTALAGCVIAGAFLLLIPARQYAPGLAEASVVPLLLAHFFILLSGNWRGWRSGERSCGILLLGVLPISLYWLIYAYYTLLLSQPMPSAMALGSTLDDLRTLALPAAFCYALIEQTVRLYRENLRGARLDPLTHLLNREGIRQLGQRRLDEHQQPSVLMLNIERFKAINETLGVSLGDQILIHSAQRLQALAQNHPGAQIGRMHADQFCVLLPQSTELQQLRQEIGQRFSQPTEVDGQSVDITLAGGIAHITSANDMAGLLRNAEIALDVARSKHKNWVVYNASLENSKHADLALLSELKRAAEQNELQLYLQPKIRLHDGDVSSAEALVRWHHPQRGMIPPGDFVPFAEKTGRITLLTHWMLAAAMRLVCDWRKQGQPLQISVNLSAFDLGEHGFVERLAKMLSDSGAQPCDLRLEITESAAMDDPDAALATMHKLCALGFSLSIDDFGTGYSSLAYLQKMPAAELKIDRAFISQVRAGSEAAALLESTIALGHRLGLSLVGEGAETIEEWTLLCDLGCDYAQGWFAAKPMPVDAFINWRSQHTPFRATLESARAEAFHNQN